MLVVLIIEQIFPQCFYENSQKEFIVALSVTEECLMFEQKTVTSREEYEEGKLRAVQICANKHGNVSVNPSFRQKSLSLIETVCVRIYAPFQGESIGTK